MKFSGKVVSNTKALNKLNRELSQSGRVHARVGVLAGNAEREEGEFNNAELGAIHELGSISGNIPARSFLRVPCLEDLPKALGKAGAKRLTKLIAEKGLVLAMKEVGVLAENVVDEAFATRGKGRWAPNAPRTIQKKGSDSPLIDKGKLRRSVTSRVYVGAKAS